MHGMAKQNTRTIAGKANPRNPEEMLLREIDSRQLGKNAAECEGTWKLKV